MGTHSTLGLETDNVRNLDLLSSSPPSVPVNLHCSTSSPITSHLPSPWFGSEFVTYQKDLKLFISKKE